MRRIFLFIISFCQFAYLFAQDSTQTEFDEKTGRPILIGHITREAFKDTNYTWWFNSEYENYEINPEELDDTPQLIKDYEIVIIVGTWCEDSHMHLPRFLKIMDMMYFPSDKIKMIAVGRGVKDLTGEAQKYNVELVPTFIFLLNGKEKGRIVEAPQEETLELDIYNIVRSR